MSGCTRQHPGAADFRGNWQRRTFRALVAGVFGFLLASMAGRSSDAPVGAEYNLKGNYLLNLAKFVEWPVTSLSGAESAFVIAVMDRGEATPVLEHLFAGKVIEGHPVKVRAVSMSGVPKDAHILLVTRMAGVTPEEVRDVLGSAPTLLVGETAQFAERGGAIAFVPEGQTVRLKLCREHAAEHGLKVSARLSTVARAVASARKN